MRPNFLTSLRSRLMASYIGLIVLGFGGLTLLAGRQLATSIMDNFADELSVKALLVSTTLVESLEHLYEGEQATGPILDRVQRFATQTGTRIVLVDPQGQAWLDSAGTLPVVDVTHQPEIAAVFNGTVTFDIRSDENGVETMYTAAPILYTNEFMGMVWLMAPTTEPRTAVWQRWLSLGGFLIVFTIVGIMLSLWLLGTLTQPLEHLRQAALKLAGGDLSQRVDGSSQDEVGAVATAFNQMAEQVQQMVQEQAAFASNAAHELRTPLTTVRLRTEWLQSPHLDQATARQYVAEIDGEVKRMAGLIDDLTLLSRLDAHRLEVGQEQVDVVRLVRALAQEMDRRALAKKQTIHLELPAQLLPVQANMNHLRVVVRNLLENALKYTPEQGQIRCHLAAAGPHLRLTVSDNGQGIAPDDLPRVGHRFYRTDKARSRRTEGVGLGLSLLDSIVRLYNGRWQIESEGLGKGTTVTVWWPFSQ